jgi:hypothetical protein
MGEIRKVSEIQKIFSEETLCYEKTGEVVTAF